MPTEYLGGGGKAPKKVKKPVEAETGKHDKKDARKLFQPKIDKIEAADAREYLYPRDVIVFGDGKERPIRLDTRETEAPRLTKLITDIQYAQVNRPNVEANRNVKLKNLASRILDLNYKRSEHNLEAEDRLRLGPWKGVNAVRFRQNKEDMLHSVAPSHRLNKLREVERRVHDAMADGVSYDAPRTSAPKFAMWER
eukprot:gnl/MRDRNA2_/MRDRNA2_104461_c0_seq1.p1 gnl/MRDRNA2_/MRDRNA2_104461_c0~~gnl/MRDRNA2_/MRDRNA2_104461_c0_seq1.p1  ORF type:complete len:196 (+),score=39.35 gnl/MRDRNA2_/MRDRNA2_104461_c0_seq1:91-678(+)